MRHRIIFINKSNEVCRGHYPEFDTHDEAENYLMNVSHDPVRGCYLIVNDENEHQILMQRKLENAG